MWRGDGRWHRTGWVRYTPSMWNAHGQVDQDARGPRPSENAYGENLDWPRLTAETTPLPAHNCRGNFSTCPRNSFRCKPPDREDLGAGPRQYETRSLPRSQQTACHIR